MIWGDVPGLTTGQRDRLVTDALADGVRGLGVTFAAVSADRAPGERVVVVLDHPSTVPVERLCRGGEFRGGGGASDRARVAAAFCTGAKPVSAVEGEVAASGPSERERLLWRTAGTLFPDDYADSYGFDVLPDWLDVGVGGSFGF